MYYTGKGSLIRSTFVWPVFLGLMAAGAMACNPDIQRAPPAGRAAQTVPKASPSSDVRTQIGFRSSQRLSQHFAKHGSEFGNVSREQYLLAAQELRDRPAGGDVQEIVRSDGTVSRFDRASGAFLAFDQDGTIRTFFKPNDGESYFRRQAQRSH